MIALFRLRWAVLVTLGASAVAPVPWGGSRARPPRAAEDHCLRVAAKFDEILGRGGYEGPRNKMGDDDLEVCQTTGHRKSCCSLPVERHLQTIAVDDMSENMANAGRHLTDLLIVNSQLYRNEFSRLLSLSRNSTRSTLTSPAFKLPPEEVEATVDALFLGLGRFLVPDGRETAVQGIADAVTAFFDSLFPAVIVFTVNDADWSLVPPDQRSCLRKARRDLDPSPFAGAAARLSRDLDRSLGVVRVLLDAFATAVDAVNATAAARGAHLDAAGCRAAVTRLLYCSYCDGHAEVRPCRGPCVDVARGCLAGVGALNVRWNLFVDAVEEVALSMRLAVDLSEVLRSLHAVVADGVLKTMETTQKYHAQLVSKCGVIARLSPPTEQARRPHPSTEGPPDVLRPPDGRPSTVSRGPGPTEVPVHLRIEMFVRNLAESREFYRKLPDSLCSSEKLSAGNYDVCWNGTALGEYTEAVPGEDYSIQVADDPEVSIPESKRAVLMTIAEKLDNMTKILRGRVIPRQLPPAQSDGRTTSRRLEMSGSGSGVVASGDDEDDDDDVISGDKITDEPEETDPTTQTGNEEREEEEDNEKDEEPRHLITSTDFIFTEKSTIKADLPQSTRSASDVVVTFTYTGGAGSTLLNFCDAGPLLLLTLSTLVLLRIV